MTRREIIACVGSAASAVALGGCGGLFSEKYRYRLTVEVETPEGLKTGAGVHEQIVGKSNVDVGDLSAKRGIRTRGEAVAVDLPGGETLFALIPDSQVAQAVLDPDWHNDWVESAQRIGSGRIPSGPLPMTAAKPADRFAKPTGFPALVRFRDTSDPKTVEDVDPANLATSFGPGFHLRRITLQRTDDAVTRG